MSELLHSIERAISEHRRVPTPDPRDIALLRRRLEALRQEAIALRPREVLQVR